MILYEGLGLSAHGVVQVGNSSIITPREVNPSDCTKDSYSRSCHDLPLVIVLCYCTVLFTSIGGSALTGEVWTHLPVSQCAVGIQISGVSLISEPPDAIRGNRPSFVESQKR